MSNPLKWKDGKKAAQKAWETELPGPGIVYANQTFTHKGATTAEQLDEELAKCNEGVAKCYPGLNQLRLISFGKPGGVPWTVSKEELSAALAKYHLIDRPPFKGYPITIKTTETMLALVDAAPAKGQMEYNVFHGVGGYGWNNFRPPFFSAPLSSASLL